LLGQAARRYSPLAGGLGDVLRAGVVTTPVTRWARPRTSDIDLSVGRSGARRWDLPRRRAQQP
jgi:hypothetical protein